MAAGMVSRLRALATAPLFTRDWGRHRRCANAAETTVAVYEPGITVDSPFYLFL